MMRLLFILLACGSAWVSAQEMLVFDLAGEQKTIGDIKPTFIVYKERELPDVSIEHVMKRYVKLFEASTSPDVKIDALNRINNLSAKYGISSKKLTIDKVIQSQVLLESYDSIVDSGIFYDRMDELLYQTAKATSFTGNREDAIKRLKLLVGLYPNSPLVDESTFRMGEAYFSLGEYAKAEAQYKKLLAFASSETFHSRALFKLGWSVFRQDRFEEATEQAFKVLDRFPELEDQTQLVADSEEEMALIEDTLRLLAIQFSKQKGADSIMAAQQRLNNERYAYLLHDALFRFHLKQDRFEEAAVVAAHYAGAYNSRYDAYTMALKTIRAYREGEFDIQEWNAKEDFVANFGVESHYWSTLKRAKRDTVRPHLIKYGEELAHLYFVRMQQARGKRPEQHLAHAEQAAHYYLQLTETDPADERNGEFVYLAAEAMRDIGNYTRSIALYERAAYDEADHDKANTAAYAAILTFDEQARAQGELTEESILQKHTNILRYADKYPEDSHSPDLLNYLANALFERGDMDGARMQAERVMAFEQASDATRYSSILVAAHSYFELENFAQAEHYYDKAVRHPLGKASRSDLHERLALSIYRQAENEQDMLKSAAAYLRLVDRVPDSTIVPQALYDASAQFLAANAWTQAIASLTHLQQAFPKHELYAASTEKLIYAYQENGEWVEAADKLMELAATSPDATLAASSLFQAAEYYQTSELSLQALDAYQGFVAAYPAEFELSIEAYDRIAAYYTEHDQRKAQTWLRKLVQYEAQNRKARTPRSASLAAQASFALAQTEILAFRQQQLTAPLKQSLARKKKGMDDAIEALQAVAAYRIQEWQSAATFEIASLYRALAKDLLASERPDSLDALQLEQYDILLEEQAYPFEEKALEVYQLNIQKVADGLYDTWIAKSYRALAEMNPTAYLREPKEPVYAESVF